MASNNAHRISFRQYQEFQRFLEENPDFENRISTPPPSTPTPASRSIVQDPEPPSSAQGIFSFLAKFAHLTAGLRSSCHAAISERSGSSPRSSPHRPAFVPAFLGMHTLAPSASSSHANQQRATTTTTLSTSGVNRDRVNHASGLPRRATSALPRRTRGPAQSGPVLPYRPDPTRVPSIRHCLVEGAEVPTVNILALVYPPHGPKAPHRDFLQYRTLHEDFKETLEGEKLVYRYTLPLESSGGMTRRVGVGLSHSTVGRLTVGLGRFNGSQTFCNCGTNHHQWDSLSLPKTKFRHQADVGQFSSLPSLFVHTPLRMFAQAAELTLSEIKTYHAFAFTDALASF
ncbi:hypothetical protein K438DRAFT_1771881 [Mycena galopus ATCC 62051]|nr:hypothetical protein K438DRAFT_1771881 [Mycena galopus ATCC 62051]